MEWARYLASGLTAAYGILILVSGFSMMRAVKGDKPAGQIPYAAKGAWSLIGLLLVAGGFLIGARNASAFWLLTGSLAAIHVLALMNGFWLYGKLNPLHQFVRLVFSAALIALAYFGLFG